MSKQSNKLIALTLVGACSFGAYKLGSALLSDETQGTEHAVNQLWIDHMPRDDRDMITHFVMIDHPQGKFGALGRSSQWRHMVDVFRWKLSGNKLGLFFPQERARGEVSISTSPRARSCGKNSPSLLPLSFQRNTSTMCRHCDERPSAPNLPCG